MTDSIILIPAYNEEENIIKVLKDIKVLGLDIDILVIDDGSDDRTRELVMDEGTDIITLPYNLGYGAALQTGFKFSKIKGYKYIIQFDGDGQHNPKDILQMINELKKGDVDIVIGSRFLGRGSLKIGFLKKIVIGLLRWIIKLSTGKKITDPTSGLKGLSKRTYEYYSRKNNFPCDYPDADIIIEMLRKGYKMREIPANMRVRNYGKSMHSGLKPLIYLLKIMLSISIVILRDKLKTEDK